MDELRIKCPSCGIILDVRNSKNEAVKRITCPNCRKPLAVTFRTEGQGAPQQLTLCYGDACYSLKEGLNVVGKKHPASKADVQIATGDPSLQLEHASVNVVRLANGDSKCVVRPMTKSGIVAVDDLTLLEGDAVVLPKGGKLTLGDTVLICK